MSGPPDSSDLTQPYHGSDGGASCVISARKKKKEEGDILNYTSAGDLRRPCLYEDRKLLINTVIILICPVWLCDASLTCNEMKLIRRERI